jgi:hypothetical protein
MRDSDAAGARAQASRLLTSKLATKVTRQSDLFIGLVTHELRDGSRQMKKARTVASAGPRFTDQRSIDLSIASSPP